MTDAPAIPVELRPEGSGRGVRVPWWAKIGGKLLLARLPIGYRSWARLGLFRHGARDRDHYRPVGAWKWALGQWTSRRGATPPGTTLELGPGDSLGSALAAAASGVRHPLLMDVGDFATRDMAHYAEVAAILAKRGTPLPGPLGADRTAMLEAIGGRYVTTGVAGLDGIATGSVGFTWSTSVLEHVRRDEMAWLLAELHRVTAPGGLGWHAVDLMDHLGGGLHNLRFGERLWEAPWFARASGFYTNRLREPEFLALARAAGFRAHVAWRERWAALPLPRARMAPPFRDMAEAELGLSGFHLVLEKPAAPPEQGSP